MIVKVYYFHVLTLRVSYELSDNAIRVFAGVKCKFLRLGRALASERKEVDTRHGFSFVSCNFTGTFFALGDDVLGNFDTDHDGIKRIVHLLDLLSHVGGQIADRLALVFLVTFNGRVIHSDDLARIIAFIESFNHFESSLHSGDHDSVVEEGDDIIDLDLTTANS